MKVVLLWLREFAPTDMDADELAELVNARGVKIEGVLRPWAGPGRRRRGARRRGCRPPGLGRLCVARVQRRAGTHQVVVGVRNMAPGDVVPWARPGSRVPILPAPLAAKELRGVVSNGMLCAPGRAGDLRTITAGSCC